MQYFLLSSQTRMAESALKKVLKEQKLEAKEIIKLNFKDDGIDALLSECRSMSLFGEEKVIVAYGYEFFSKRPKAPKGNDFSDLIVYLETPNPDVHLFFLGATFEKEGKVSAAFLKGGGKLLPVQEFTPIEWERFANRYFAKRGVQIDNDALKELLTRTKGDYALFLEEAKKLVIYADNESLKLSDVESLVTRPLEDDAFRLGNALLKKDLKEVYRVYLDLSQNSFEAVSFLHLLTQQFRFQSLATFLKEKHYSLDEAADLLKSNHWRTKIAYSLADKANSEYLNTLFSRLYMVEKAIMTGKLEATLAFPLFLLEIDFHALRGNK